MKVIVFAKKYTAEENVKEEVRTRLDKKLSKLDKFFPDEALANVCMVTERGRDKLELTITYKGTMFRAEVFEDDMFSAVDKASDIIERQIRKNKTRLAKRLKENAFQEFAPDGIEEEEYKITKIKKYSIKPMSAEEAILEMNLLGHNFFLFRDEEKGDLRVVYKKNNSEYGIIEPTDE